VPDLSLRVNVGNARLGLERLSICGVLLFDFVGMLPRPPFFQGLRVYFIDPPKIDIAFHGSMTGILNVTPVKNAILSSIASSLTRTMVVPHRVGTTFSDEFDWFRTMSPRPRGVLELSVWSAEELLAADFNGSSDPYIRVLSGSSCFRSPTTWKTLSPTFNFKVGMMIWVLRHQSLRIEVWDEDRVGSDDLLGYVEFPVVQLVSWGQERRCIELLDEAGEPGRSGRLWVTATWRPLLLERPAGRAGGIAAGPTLVFAGVYSVTCVPLAQEGTQFWVEAQCTNVKLEWQLPEQQQTWRYKQEKPAGSDESAAKLKRLMDKVAVCRRYSMSAEDLAEVLDLDLADARGLRDGRAQAPQAMGKQDIEWDDSFEFLVENPASSAVTFTLKSQEPGSKKEAAMGTCTVSVKDLLDGGSCTAVQTVKLSPHPEMMLKLRLQVRVLGQATTEWRQNTSLMRSLSDLPS